jgi:uncharacterized membrane protein
MKWFKSLIELPLVVGILALGMFSVLVTSPYDYSRLVENIRALALWPTVICLFALLFFVKDAVGAVIAFFKKDTLLALLWAAVAALLVCTIPYLFDYTIFIASHLPIAVFAGIYLFVILLAGIGASFKQALFGHLAKPAEPQRRVTSKPYRPPVRAEPMTKVMQMPKPSVPQPDSTSDGLYSRPIPKSLRIYAY